MVLQKSLPKVLFLALSAGTFFFAVLLPTDQARAQSASLGFVDLATAQDDGPQDGMFDAFAPFNLGSVNNNGFTSFRTAAEFNLSSIPIGATISSATLTGLISWSEGDLRFLQVHAFAGDGSVQLGDFGINNLVGITNLVRPPENFSILSHDVTSFVGGLFGSGNTFVGFGWREEPANGSNFTVMNMATNGFFAPTLNIEYSTAAPIPEPSTYALLLAGLALLGFEARRRRML